MISRRGTSRHWRRTPGGLVVPGGAPAWTPANITSVTKVFWLRSDLGITIGTGVSAWADQFGLHDATQATGASQPTVTASALDGHAALTFDGSDDYLVFSTLDLPAPNATNIFIWFILKQVTWVSNDIIFGGRAGALPSIYAQQRASSPGICQFNSSVVNTNNGAAVGAWVRGRALFTGSTSDYIRLGSSTTTGSSAGVRDTSSGQWAIGANDTGAAPANFEICEILCTLGEPTELAQLEAYGAARYPSAGF